ncbi:MAG: zinc-dependent metalloprotease [Reichenbachiella sp.]
MKNLILTVSLFCIFFTALNAQKKNSKVPANSKIKYEGYFNFSYDSSTDRIALEVKQLNVDFMYVNSLVTGLGSNDIGLDRGQIGNSRVVKFAKAGNKLLLIQPNQKFRALSDNPEEVRAVEEAFSHSVLYGFEIISKSNGVYTIDITDFLMQDAHDVSGQLERSKQGNYQLEKSRSALYLERTKNFPKNTEFEALLTFTGKPKGKYIKSVAPTPSNLTVRQHHSFVELPDDDYEPRVFDPRAGYFTMSYLDYATPIDQPIEKRFIYRHRLKKKDPSAEISEAVVPIIYYLDRGAPEPIRSALMEGAQWWNQAFEEIGYKDAFQVKLLPEGVDPLDIRYNVIQWVHRSTRGWSYGGGVFDPRTGEIIKGHVSLGSLRVRQDFLIAEGLLAPYENGTEIPEEMEEMALARLRQLSAHEVGHTIGLAHSYSSSTEGRASVMDYPHPLAEIEEGKIVLKNAYDDKIGNWDKVAVAYGYQDFVHDADEQKELDKIILNSLKNGLSFLSDQDARPQGGAHPYAHLWDNGEKAYDELDRVMEVRKIALEKFGENNIRKNIPYAYLEEVLVPIYFYHRYQLEAAVKYVGGLNYRYAVRGDGQLITQMISDQEQMNALNAIINSLSPESLTLPESIISSIPPHPLGYYRTREIPNVRTSLTFDPLSMATASADMTFDLLFQPSRFNRLLEYNARDASQPGVEKVLDGVMTKTWKSVRKTGFQKEIQHTVEMSMLQGLFSLASDANCTAQVKAITWLKLDELNKWLATNMKKDEAHFYWAKNQIDLFKKNPWDFKKEPVLELPDGSPIGMDFSCDFK